MTCLRRLAGLLLAGFFVVTPALLLALPASAQMRGMAARSAPSP